MSKVLLIIVGASVITFLIRYLPLQIFKGRNLPTPARRLFSYLPVAILSALAIQSLLLEGGRYPKVFWAFILSAIACVGVGAMTKNIGLVIVFGIGVAGLLILVFGGR